MHMTTLLRIHVAYKNVFMLTRSHYFAQARDDQVFMLTN